MNATAPSKKEMMHKLTERMDQIALDDNGIDYVAIVDYSHDCDVDQIIRAESKLRQAIPRQNILRYLKDQKQAYEKKEFKERGAEMDNTFMLVHSGIGDLFIFFANADPGEYQAVKLMSAIVRPSLLANLAALAKP